MTADPHQQPPGPSPASRGLHKLAHALDEFGIDVAGLVCADLGCSTGGFVDCLLRRGATRVYAVDTAYGELDYRLRTDPRVVVMERTNALHAEPAERVDLVTIDLGWTRQDKAIPAARLWLRPGGRIVSLVKPHYEVDTAELDRIAPGRVLPDEVARDIAERVTRNIDGFRALTASPIRGGAKRKGAGNMEWLALIQC